MNTTELVELLSSVREAGWVRSMTDRYDQGNVGQTLERLMGVEENNLAVADLAHLGVEIKAIRSRSSRLTLFHKAPDIGMGPLTMFEAIGQVRRGREGVMKKKLFMTVKGTPNKRGFYLVPLGGGVGIAKKGIVFLGWSKLESSKLNQVLLVEADSKGPSGSPEEMFRFTKATLLKDPVDLVEACLSGVVTLDLCIDSIVGSSKRPHDRGTHFRVTKKRLPLLFNNYIEI